jgi:alpha-amylase/alpha-mannosidase (GH57 family)
VPYPISWADEERDLSAWIGNNLQDDALEKLSALSEKIEEVDDVDLKRDWNYLQSSDHFYYMCTKWLSDGDVHKYYNPYPSPYEAYINYMNVLSDFAIRLEEKSPGAAEIMDNVLKNTSKLGKELGKMASKKIQEAEKSVKEKYQQTKAKSKPVFEDIMHLSDAKVKKLIKELEAEQLAVALKDASEEIRGKVIPNLTQKAKKQMEDLQQKMTEIKQKDIQAMRKKVEEKLKNFF